jgi:hypothetical protein
VLVGLQWLPERVADLMVALAYTLAAPSWINFISKGWARRTYCSARYQPGWLSVYVLVMAAVVGPRLQWPPLLSMAFGALALTATAVLALDEIVRHRRLVQ